MFKKIRQVLLLGLVLIGFPLISYYYLQSGLEFRKAKLGEMEDMGKLTSFRFAYDEELRSSEIFLNDKLSLIAFDTVFTSLELERFQAISQPFGDRMDVVAIAASPMLTEVDPFLAEPGFGYAQTNVTKSSPLYEQVNRLADQKELQLPVVVLADKDRTIRNIYPMMDEKSGNLLMEHIAILIPTLKYGRDEQ